ncbi:MAG TPA: hypothetical protein VGG01_00335 [Xanthobacteraceae bacterium]
MNGPTPGNGAEQVDLDAAARTAATDFARDLADVWFAAPDLDVLGVYIIGSLAISLRGKIEDRSQDG